MGWGAIITAWFIGSIPLAILTGRVIRGRVIEHSAETRDWWQ